MTALTTIIGMTAATLLTLLVVPIFYTFFDDARIAMMRTLRRAFRQKVPAPAIPGELPRFPNRASGS